MPRPVVRRPGVCGGAPCIDGTRLTCSDVVLMLKASPGGLEEYLRPYPHLTKDDVRSCLEYCAAQQCLVNSQVRYCFRCSLDRTPPPPPPDATGTSLEDALKAFREGSGGQIFLGTPAEYEKAVAPKDVWKVAEDLLRREEWQAP